jgi:hypothetical protein
METYTQSFQKDISQVNVKTLVNCFFCHNGVSSVDSLKPRSPLYISHVFEDYTKSSKGKSRKEINRMKDQQFLLRFIKKELK